jgi:hypothetical protein
MLFAGAEFRPFKPRKQELTFRGEFPVDPKGVADLCHSFRMRRFHRLPARGLSSAATPGYFLPTLRVPSGLKKPGIILLV